MDTERMFSNEESACSECHHVFEVETGELVDGWEKVHIVSPGPLICKSCKDAMIDALAKDIPR